MKNLLLFLPFAALFMGGCMSVPETGRSGLSLVSDSEISALAATEFSQMKNSVKISTDAKNAGRIREIGKNIVRQARGNAPFLPEPDAWEFVLFDDPQVNAFAMPGGKVGFYTGMLKVAETDDEIAVILGHEVFHVAAKHSAERMSYELLRQGSILALGVGLGMSDYDDDTREIALAAFGMGTQVGVMLPFSRSDEYESDKIGLLYAARAGYNPEAGPRLWRKMAALGADKPAEFLSTHPSDENRIREMEKQMPELLKIYEATKSKN